MKLKTAFISKVLRCDTHHLCDVLEKPNIAIQLTVKARLLRLIEAVIFIFLILFYFYM